MKGLGFCGFPPFPQKREGWGTLVSESQKQAQLLLSFIVLEWRVILGDVCSGLELTGWFLGNFERVNHRFSLLKTGSYLARGYVIDLFYSPFN
jgi:hypothetical protein